MSSVGPTSSRSDPKAEKHACRTPGHPMTGNSNPRIAGPASRACARRAIARAGWRIPPTALWSASALKDVVVIKRNGAKWFKRGHVVDKAGTQGTSSALKLDDNKIVRINTLCHAPTRLHIGSVTLVTDARGRPAWALKMPSTST